MAAALVETLVGVDWVAARLGKPRTRIYDLVRRNAIPHVRLGRSVLFDRAAIEKFLASGGTKRSEGAGTAP